MVEKEVPSSQACTMTGQEAKAHVTSGEIPCGFMKDVLHYENN